MRRTPQAGLVRSLVLVFLLALAAARSPAVGRAQPIPGQAAGQPRVVTSAADSGPGTLRQALLDARPGETITFDPGSSSPTAPAAISSPAPCPPSPRTA